MTTPYPSGPVDSDACKRFDVWPYDVVVLEGTIERGREDPLVVINH
jgi:hypothetical protein